MDGDDLITWMDKKKSFAEADARQIMKELLDAVSHSHKCGVAHCDIKFENVMLTNSQQVKLVDFGWSRDPARTAKPIRGHPNDKCTPPEVRSGDFYVSLSSSLL